MFIEIRSEQDTGKLLFKWDPQTNVVSIVNKDKLYSVALSCEGREYRILETMKKTKK